MLSISVRRISRQGIIGFMYYYEVAPVRIIRAKQACFTYHHDQILSIGQLVSVSVGKQILTGIIIRNVSRPNYETKVISSVLPLPPIPKQLIDTACWMSSYYATHLATVIQMVLPRGITKKRRISASRDLSFSRDRTHFLLNETQSLAVDTLNSMKVGTAILHGVTGSGKTAVYIEHAKHILSSGKSVILLVPEIALTSQLLAEFQQHFPSIIVSHSQQTEAERHRVWQQVLDNLSPVIVIGPRSALFLPIKSIGAIIVDEAHEPSYKQDQAPRYSALRVASVLARAHEAHVIQGTATPLISEYYLASMAHQPVLTMRERAVKKTLEPNIEVVDMTNKALFRRHRLFSDSLIQNLTDALAAGHQVLLFHNRRGSATITLCDQCGWSALCPVCSTPLTLHADVHQLQCHVCGKNDKVPTVCPNCHNAEIIHKGIGTKLIESEIAKLFPEKVIARFDGDTQLATTLEKRYQELYDGKIDIIIGTQVVAKGLDLPHLRTVGVIQADAGLSLPDYIASERTFQLISQVIGRVGRSAHKTSVILQSYQPDHPAIKLGITQDYQEFYQTTLSERRGRGFPPFTYLLKLTCIYKTERAAIRNSQQLANRVKNSFPHVAVLGPTPAFYERRYNSYRWQLLVQSKKRSTLLEIVSIVPPSHWQVDLDPYTLL